MSKALLGVTIALTLCLTTQSKAQELSRPGVEPLTTELVLELRVEIGTLVSSGESDLGTRRYIPITGGEFEGVGLRGEVLPCGADRQLVRPDGVAEIKAVYSIRAGDGAVIWVENEGLADPSAEPRYVRTRPVFRAPAGPYERLNKRLFTGTITPGRGAVIIRVFVVN